MSSTSTPVQQRTIEVVVSLDRSVCKHDAEGVCGRYSVAVDADLNDADSASCALDVLHSNVAIDNLECYQFSTYVVYHKKKREISQGEAESYSLTARGRMI